MYLIRLDNNEKGRGMVILRDHHEEDRNTLRFSPSYLPLPNL